MKSSWIWHNFPDTGKTNQTLHFRRDFVIDSEIIEKNPVLEITADSRYRLSVNGHWLGDGPFRCWPEHYLYDPYEISSVLNTGTNRIDVYVTYYGVNNFQYIAARPGLACSIICGEQELLNSDKSWQVRIAEKYLSNVPRFGCQLGFEETYDARRAEAGRWEQVNIIRPCEEDDHLDLTSSPVPKLTCNPRAFSAPLRTAKVKTFDHSFALRRDECLSPDFGVSYIVEMSGIFRANIHCTKETFIDWRFNLGFTELYIDDNKIEWESESWVDGVRKASTSLSEGEHRISAVVANSNDNINDILIGCFSSAEITFSDWQVLKLDDGKDIVSAITSEGQSWRDLTKHELAEPSASFEVRNAIELSNDVELSLSEESDLMLLFELGELSVGYPELIIDAEEGTIVEGYGVEYIADLNTPDEWVQHTANKLNGFRIICSEGKNHWVARERRGMRYLFLVIKNHRNNANIKNVRLIESAYPVQTTPVFNCDDEKINKIHKVACHTLKLCMEDTFTDCPTYEQVTWIGDARNEALFNYYSFGADDIVRRTLEIGAQSLEHFDLVCCFGPVDYSVSQQLGIPAWSFLWSIAVWEHYLYIGDKQFLEKIYPALKMNTENAISKIDNTGLFRGAGMFDWTPIDHNKSYVTHNQMFLYRSLITSARCAEALGKSEDADHWRDAAKRLKVSINAKLWSIDQNSYVDGMDDNGELSKKICQHTNALSLLYEIVQEENREAALKNVISPPDHMTKVGSPFAMFFFIEAYIKIGKPELAMKTIEEYWGQMIDHGATTFWEMIEDGWLTGKNRKATRSHCHGWSCAPLDFFGRVILGVTPLEPGFAKVKIDPKPCGLTEASGEIPTPHGPIKVSWRINDAGVLDLAVNAPEEIEIISEF